MRARATRCLFAASLLTAILISACSSNGPSAGTSATLQQQTSPISSPSIPQTRTPLAATPTPGVPRPGSYGLARILPAANFDRMLGFVLIPGSETDAAVVTQGGRIYRAPLDGRGEPALFGDLSSRLSAARGNEEGLLGLAFPADFPTTNRVYAYYTRGSPQPSILSRFEVTGGRLNEGSEQVLLEIPQPSSNHNGGQLTFGPDGYLYLALGDGGSAGDPQGNGQDLGSLLGKILRLDVSDGRAGPAPGNPFIGRPGARQEIYAYGLRNPWRFSFDRATGEMWAGDVGQNRFEEVNRIIAGENYGWNVMEGSECFATTRCDPSGLRLPRAVYGRDGGCSITGGYVYRGPSMPELTGWYVYGDFCSGNIWAVNTTDTGPPVLLAASGLGISTFGELPDGELVALTFQRGVYRLQRAS